MKEEKLFSRLVGFCAILYALYAFAILFHGLFKFAQDSHSLTKISSTFVQRNITGVMKTLAEKSYTA